jgi:hypothetical protein
MARAPAISLSGAVSLAFILSGTLSNGAQVQRAKLDDSDWWSTQIMFNHMDLSAPSTNAQNRQPPTANFEIAGIVLGKDQFDKAAAKLGKAPVAKRGDGANSRNQICYSSLEQSQDVHLVFEEDGEGFGYSFYLFEGGSPWNGIDLCVRSALVSTNLHTGSRLHLGQSESEVRSILGEPSTTEPDKFKYVYETKRKTSAEKLAGMRRAYPNLQDKELHGSFDFYYAHTYVETRFINFKLAYLAITKSETFP